MHFLAALSRSSRMKCWTSGTKVGRVDNDAKNTGRKNSDEAYGGVYSEFGVLTRPIEVSAGADIENDTFDTDEQWQRCITAVILRQLFR